MVKRCQMEAVKFVLFVEQLILFSSRTAVQYFVLIEFAAAPEFAFCMGAQTNKLFVCSLCRSHLIYPVDICLIILHFKCCSFFLNPNYKLQIEAIVNVF